MNPGWPHVCLRGSLAPQHLSPSHLQPAQQGIPDGNRVLASPGLQPVLSGTGHVLRHVPLAGVVAPERKAQRMPRPTSRRASAPGPTHLCSSCHPWPGQSPADRSRRSDQVHCGRSENRGWGPPNIRPCLGRRMGGTELWWSAPTGHSVHPSLSGLPRPPQGRGKALTHTKLSLGIQLKALRAADFILVYKAKGQVLRMPGHCGQGAPGQTAAPAVAPSCQPGQVDAPQP